jgi:hypothetical protein
MLLNKKNRDGDIDCEEETRSLMLLQLQSYGRDAVDEMDLIEQVHTHVVSGMMHFLLHICINFSPLLLLLASNKA